MKKSKNLIGSLGEQAAEKYLLSLGYKIIEKNFKDRYGEIDIIALDGNILVFVEVKTRSNDTYGIPEEAINYRKVQHLTNAINFYKLLHPTLPASLRIDVVTVMVNKLFLVDKISLYKNITL